MFTNNKKHIDWLENVYEPAKQSQFMGVALLGSFHAPIIQCLLQHTGFILHFYGVSSTGKSTLGRVANSVWRSDTENVSWYSKTKELEDTLEANNNQAIFIDESSGIDTIKKLRDISYKAFNITNIDLKNKENQEGARRGIAGYSFNQINSVIISTGENSLKSIKYFDDSIDDNVKPEIVDINVIGEAGVLTDSNNRLKNAEIINKISENACTYYGEVGKLFTFHCEAQAERISTNFYKFLDKGGVYETYEELKEKKSSYTEKQRNLFNIFNILYFTALELIEAGVLPEESRDYFHACTSYVFHNNKENL